MALKIAITQPKNLDAAQSVAYSLMSSKLVGAAAGQQKRNVWKDVLSRAINSYALADRGVEAIDEFERDVSAAIVSAAVNEALQASGYGNIGSVSKDEKDKAIAPKAVESYIVRTYGRLGVVHAAQKSANATLVQYCGDIRRAAKLGCELDETMTRADVLLLAKNAEEKALSPEKQAENAAARARAEQAAAIAKANQAAYLASPRAVDVLTLVNSIIIGADALATEVYEEMTVALMEWADRCLTAHQEQQKREKIARGDDSGDDDLPNVPPQTEDEQEQEVATA